MLTLEEVKKDLYTFQAPVYGEPELLDDNEDFLVYKVSIPKVVLNAPACGGCSEEGCEPCGDEEKGE